MGTPEEWLLWRRDFDEVLKGMHLTTGPAHFAQARTLLSGEALRTFNEKANTLPNATIGNCKECIKAVTEMIFPPNAAARQRIYLVQNLKKPRGITVRQFSARLSELNAYLERFPQGQRIDDNDLRYSFFRALPKAWQRSMGQQGLVIHTVTLRDVVERAERFETTENIYDDVHKGRDANTGRNAGANTGPKRGRGNNNNNNNNHNGHKKKKARTGHYCLVHGPDRGHNSDECKVLKSFADKSRQIYNSNRANTDSWKNRRNNNNGNYRNNNGNNNYSNSNNHNIGNKRNFTRAEVHALLTQVTGRQAENNAIDTESAASSSHSNGASTFTDAEIEALMNNE